MLTHANVHPFPLQLQKEVEAMFTALLESVTKFGEIGAVADLQDSKVPAILKAADRTLLERELGSRCGRPLVRRRWQRYREGTSTGARPDAHSLCFSEFRRRSIATRLIRHMF